MSKRWVSVAILALGAGCIPGVDGLAGLVIQGAQLEQQQRLAEQQRRALAAQEEARRQEAAWRTQQDLQRQAMEQQRAERERQQAVAREQEAASQRAAQDHLAQQAAARSAAADLAAQQEQAPLAALEGQAAAPIVVRRGHSSDDLRGRLVRVDAQISATDEEAGYLDFQIKETLCAALDPLPRMHWGRRGGGGSRRGGGGHHSSSHSSSYSSSSSRTGGHHSSGGGYYSGGHGSSHKGGHYRNAATGDHYRSSGAYAGQRRSYGSSSGVEESVSGYDAPMAPREVLLRDSHVTPVTCRKREVVSGVMLRLSHPAGYRLQAGDRVRVEAIASPTASPMLLNLDQPRIALLGRGDAVLIGDLEERPPG